MFFFGGEGCSFVGIFPRFTVGTLIAGLVHVLWVAESTPGLPMPGLGNDPPRTWGGIVSFISLFLLKHC